MYVKLGVLFICLASALTSVYAAGQVTFIHRPESVVFKGSEEVDQSLLKEVFAASLGFTIKQSSSWSGMRITNPFHFAEAIVTLIVDGIDALEDVKGHHFQMNTNEDEYAAWVELEQRLRNRFPSQNNTVVRIELSDGPSALLLNSIWGEVSDPVLPNTHFLDFNVSEDHEFLGEVALLQEIIKKVRSFSRDGIPDIYWFVLPGLHAVRDMHGAEADATLEAKKILTETIVNLNSAFKTAYDGRVLVSIITSDVSHTRRTRYTRFAPTQNESIDINRAPDYEDTYPVMFNIFLWSTVIFIMALIGISIGHINMDPGRDSIIYRMTTIRMKKDN